MKVQDSYLREIVAVNMGVTDSEKQTSIFFRTKVFQVEVEVEVEGWTEDLLIPISRYVTHFPLCHRFPVSGGIGAHGIKREIYPQRGSDSRVR